MSLVEYNQKVFISILYKYIIYMLIMIFINRVLKKLDQYKICIYDKNFEFDGKF